MSSRKNRAKQGWTVPFLYPSGQGYNNDDNLLLFMKTIT